MWQYIIMFLSNHKHSSHLPVVGLNYMHLIIVSLEKDAMMHTRPQNIGLCENYCVTCGCFIQLAYVSLIFFSFQCRTCWEFDKRSPQHVPENLRTPVPPKCADLRWSLSKSAEISTGKRPWPTRSSGTVLLSSFSENVCSPEHILRLRQEISRLCCSEHGQPETIWWRATEIIRARATCFCRCSDFHAGPSNWKERSSQDL